MGYYPKWIRNLRNGDEVFWTDPDGGCGSRHYKIRSIDLKGGGAIRIEDVDGDVLECFSNELS